MNTLLMGHPNKQFKTLKSYKSDSGVPSQCWDIIVQHACLINAMVYPSPSNPDIIISEAQPNSITHLHVVPPVGCFCCRLQQNTDTVDPSHDPAYQYGVFLGYLGITFGSIILTEKALVVARYNLAYDKELPFLQKAYDNPRLSFLRNLHGTSPSGPAISRLILAN